MPTDNIHMFLCPSIEVNKANGLSECLVLKAEEDSACVSSDSHKGAHLYLGKVEERSSKSRQQAYSPFQRLLCFLVLMLSGFQRRVTGRPRRVQGSSEGIQSWRLDVR